MKADTNSTGECDRAERRIIAVALYYEIMQTAFRMRTVEGDGMSYEDVISFDALIKAAHECELGVGWKCSTQMYKVNKLQWVSNLARQLENGTYKSRGFNEFKINERGKERAIKAVHISERTVQKSLVQNALRPAIIPRLIYDNSASLESKGTEFAIKRLKQHLAHHYRKYGRKGGILIMDYKSFFDSIDHDILLKQLRNVIDDDRTYELTKMFIDCFPKGLGLGSEVSQICAIFYPNEIDHFVKEKLHIRGYGRYMDDSYIISDSINHLKYCKYQIENLLSKFNLSLNQKRTQIVCFCKGSFCYLKKRIFISETGKIVIRLARENVTRHRRTVKRMYNRGVDPRKCHISWRGYALKYNAYRTVTEADRCIMNNYS